MVCLAAEPTRGLARCDIVVDVTVDAMSLYWLFSTHLLRENEGVGYSLNPLRGATRSTEPTHGLSGYRTHSWLSQM